MPLTIVERGPYDRLIRSIFRKHHRRGVKSFEFDWFEVKALAAELEITPSRKIRDALSVPCWNGLPEEIRDTQPPGYERSVQSAGRLGYRFRLVETGRILPHYDHAAIDVLDATPAIVSTWAVDDRQALLARVRYNHLIGLFCGLSAHSLGSQLTRIVEIDELYVGIGRNRKNYVIPIQANGSSDLQESIRTMDHIAFCAEKFPGLKCLPVSVRSVARDVIALFELTVQGGRVRIAEERHYRLL